jgi:flagellum-specific ATP synthase
VRSDSSLFAVERPPYRHFGRVTASIGMRIEARGLEPDARIGDLCVIDGGGIAEIVGFTRDRFLLSPLRASRSLAPGALIRRHPRGQRVPTGPALLGRVIDGFGHSLHELPRRQPIPADDWRPFTAIPIPPLTRERITQIFPTGIRAVDGFCTLGYGQRVGIFAGSGVGKSTMLGMLARRAAEGWFRRREDRPTAVVIGLIGERGREVREFLEDDLGERGLERAVVVVSTADDPPGLRVRAARYAVFLAADLRDRGWDVLLLIDSLTRVAMAQREIGIAIGEPMTARSYTPSVFSLLTQLIEQTGNSHAGSLTAIFTVLVESDDLFDPLVDAARAVLDGHIVLDRRLADAGHFPAISITRSLSRLMPAVVSEEHARAASALRDLIAYHEDHQDLLSIGAYRPGFDAKLDAAIALRAEIDQFLRQDRSDSPTPLAETIARLRALAPAS